MMRIARLRPYLDVPAAACLLIAAGWLASGHLSVFGDTMAYIRQGEFWATWAGLSKPIGDPPLFGEHVSLMASALAKFGPSQTAAAAARSPFYGFFLFIVGGTGRLWSVAVIQSIVAAWLLRVASRALLLDRRAYWFLIAGLALGTSLPFFVNFAMPDVFGGLGYLSTILYLIAADRLSRTERFGLWLLVIVAVLFHRANAPVVCLLTITGCVMLRKDGLLIRAILEIGGALLSALLVALLATTAVHTAFQRSTGYPMGMPPFLMSRVLLDGPGKEYLERACPGGVAPVLCRFQDRLMADENDVLWRTEGGIFGSTDYPTQLKLKAEEPAFVLAAISLDPWAALKAALRNWTAQFMMFFVDDPLGDPGRLLAKSDNDHAALKHLMPSLTPCKIPGGCQTIPMLTTKWALFVLHAGVLLTSLVVMASCRMTSVDPRSQEDGLVDHLRMVRHLGVLVVSSVVLNAACFGILSGPYARYQARIIWLIPMAAILTTLAYRRFAAPTSAQLAKSSWPTGLRHPALPDRAR